LFIAGPLVAGREPKNWQQAIDLGIDAILTDHPLELRQLIRSMKPAGLSVGGYWRDPLQSAREVAGGIPPDTQCPARVGSFLATGLLSAKGRCDGLP
jgi:hypothetical protein